MKIIIPMSGKGSRFVKAGYKDVKPLIIVDNKPIIQHVIELFPGETDIHCICNDIHLKTTDMRNILNNYGVKIHEIKQHNLGPVMAVSHIFDIIDDNEEIIISYCDYGTEWNYNKFLEEARLLDGSIAAYKGFHPHMLGTDNYAFLKMNNNHLIEIREKEPFTDNKMNEYASNGTYYFKKGSYVKKYFTEVLNSGDKWIKNGEYYVSLVYNLMVRDGLMIGAFEISKMLQWGTPADLETYNMWLNHFNQGQMLATSKSSATLILPLAGKGSRFSLLGYSTPKPLLDINGKPMIIRAVESIPECSKKVFICLNEHLKEYDLKNIINSEFINALVIGIDDVTQGQACTCEIGINQANLDDNEPIMISACDNGVDYNIEEYLKLENDLENDIIVWSFDNNPTSKQNPHMYAWLDVDSNNIIKNVSVKKYFEGARHCIIGTMFFRSVKLFKEGLKQIYENNIRTNGEFYVDDLLNPLIKMGYKVKVFNIDRYICWGTPNDYKTYQYWLEHFSNKFGKPHIM